jgi:hypothetical protein
MAGSILWLRRRNDAAVVVLAFEGISFALSVDLSFAVRAAAVWVCRTMASADVMAITKCRFQADAVEKGF